MNYGYPKKRRFYLEQIQPWSNGDATSIIRELAKDINLNIAFTTHFTDRMSERNLIMSDILFALKNGFVRIDPWVSSIPSFYKYSMESKTPNSANRSIRVVSVPEFEGCAIKLISVMWVDESETRSGTLLGEE